MYGYAKASAQAQAYTGMQIADLYVKRSTCSRVHQLSSGKITCENGPAS